MVLSKVSICGSSCAAPARASTARRCRRAAPRPRSPPPRARARLHGEPPPERGDAAPRTTFSSRSATGVVEDALLTNRDLNGTLDFMTVDGSGTGNLVGGKVGLDFVR